MDERRSRIEADSEEPNESGRSRARCRQHALRTGVAALTVFALAGCQSYEPSPLNSAAHREAWHARTLEDGSLREFLDRLDQEAGEPAGGFDSADGLSLSEGRLVALVFNPDLRLARLGVGRAAATAEYASLWADPELAISVLNITDAVPDPWVITPTLTFTIPISGRLGAEQDRADAAVRAAEKRALEAEWAVWRAVRDAWTVWSAARLRLQETGRLVDALDRLVLMTRQLAESGEIQRPEATLFSVEQAQRRNLMRRLQGDVDSAEQRLRALLGLSPEAPVTFVPSIGLETGGASAEGGPDEIAARNPGLARLREEYDVAEETLRREIREQIPDLSLGPAYEFEEGQSRVGFLGWMALPLWNANRQAIAEARVGRDIARAGFETEYESLVGRWSAASARAEALARQREDIEEVLVPLVDDQLEDAQQLMSLGEGTSLVLLESITRAHQTKLELIETRAAEALAHAELEYLTGPLAPAISETDSEAPEPAHAASEDTP